jgi:hypothetical protein
MTIRTHWHGVIERAVDRHPVSCTLVRMGTPDVSVTLNVTPQQFQEQPVATAGSVVQQSQRWMIPAARLAATTWPGPPREGDLMIFPLLKTQARIDTAAPGLAGGEVVRWDVTLTGDLTA